MAIKHINFIVCNAIILGLIMLLLLARAYTLLSDIYSSITHELLCTNPIANSMPKQPYFF